MDRKSYNMDKSLIKLPVYKETKFRAISSYEKNCKLWVDRIGATRQQKTKIEKLRMLGQFAAVAIEDGNGYLITASKGKISVSSNDVILITPDDACAYTPKNSWISRWVVWNGSEASSIFNKIFGKKNTRVLHNAGPAVIKAVTLLNNFISLESLAGALKRKAIILNLFYDFLDTMENKDIYNKKSPHNKIVNTIEFIRENLHLHHSITELSKRSNMSISHFRRLFIKHTGKSPIEFINTEKILKAKEQLLKGMTIKQVAEVVGVDDTFYFMRLFKKIAGTTAGNFAAQHKNIL
jgi:AraC-like DNA-binding protein